MVDLQALRELMSQKSPNIKALVILWGSRWRWGLEVANCMPPRLICLLGSGNIYFAR